ncbi:MAG TPA: hypothetical protein PLQ21_08470, partial [Candidatus Kapabacteria bacterium]|nr:hypothetical protein [Candidatus Kapabacteria bacterium]
MMACLTPIQSYAIGGASKDKPVTQPPPIPPPLCPEQDTITYYNPSSIGDCVHPQLIQSRLTRYYYPNPERTGCVLWKELRTSHSYQCIKQGSYYSCVGGECVFSQYFSSMYGPGTNLIAETSNTSTEKTFSTYSETTRTINKQKQYSTFSSPSTGVSEDDVVFESITDEEHNITYGSPAAGLLAHPMEHQKSINISVSNAYAMCHSNIELVQGYAPYFLSFRTYHRIDITEDSSFHFGPYGGTSSFKHTWKERTLTPANICEVYANFEAPEYLENDRIEPI